MDDEALEKYLHDSLDILHDAIEQYQHRKKHFYRVAALQLRLLLCDTTRRHGKSISIALIPRLIPDLMLPSISSTGKSPSCDDLLPLKSWLAQPIGGTAKETISIRQFIRIICDQDGGAHVDHKPTTDLTGIIDREEKIISIGIAFLHGISRWLDKPGLKPANR